MGEERLEGLLERIAVAIEYLLKAKFGGVRVASPPSLNPIRRPLTPPNHIAVPIHAIPSHQLPILV